MTSSGQGRRGTTRGPTEGARTLPARYYRDPEIFERENARIQRRRWIAACPAEELAGVGDYQLVKVAGDSLIVVRDGGGAIRAHHNVCRHRGTRMLGADRGRLSGSIQCPYHAWTYGLDGALRRAPHMDGADGFCVDDYPLVGADCATWGGMVWVRLAPRGQSLDEQLGKAAERLAPWDPAAMGTAHTERYDVRANWKLVIQNFSECLHCPVIHPQLQRFSHYLSGDNFPVTASAIGSTMELGEGVETLSTDGRLVGTRIPGLPERLRRKVGYEILLPNLMFCLHPDYVVRYILRAVAPGRTRIRCDWLFRREVLGGPDFSPGRAVDFWHLTNQQDWKVCELSQQGIGSSAYRPGPYSAREDQLWQIDHLLKDLLSSP